MNSDLPSLPLPQNVVDYINEKYIHGWDGLAFEPNPFPEIPISFILTQLEGRKIAEKKFPSLLRFKQFIYPHRVSLEQATSEVLAEWKNSYFKFNSLLDCTGGMGIDTYYLSKQSEKAYYIEQDKRLCQLAIHNFKVLHAEHIQIINDRCEHFVDFVDTMQDLKVDLAYVDPDRRASGQRLIAIDKLQPNIVDLQNKLQTIASQLLIKLSPLQDIHDAVSQLRHVHQVIVLSYNNEVKELLLYVDPTRNETKIIACNLNGKEETYRYEEKYNERPEYQFSEVVKKYIYQMPPAITKAQLDASMAQSFGLEKIAPDTSLFTSDTYDDAFPGRIFEIESEKKLQAKAFKNIHQLNIISKNHPLKPSAIAHKLKLSEGGSKYLIATTDWSKKRRVFICNRIK